MNIFSSIIKNWKLIGYLSRNDIRNKYAGSYLGVIWAFIQPIVTILVYWFVFEVGLRGGGKTSNAPFILVLICGLIPWFFFAESLNSATSSFIEYSYLVKKVVFDVEILPLVKIISSLIVHIFFVFVLILVLSLYGYYPKLQYIQVIYYSFCMICLVFALSYITSSLMVFFRDISQMIAVSLQVGMWLTPILWSYTAIENLKIAFIFKLNPMFYIVEGYRAALLEGKWFWEMGYLTLYFWLLILVLMIISFRIFKKLRPHFSDSL